MFTWISPNKKTKNQIDYILVSKNWFSSFTDYRTRPGADSDTDHDTGDGKGETQKIPKETGK